MKRFLYVCLILSIFTYTSVYANDNYISPIKDLELEFKLDIDNYIFENYRGFILNIKIPDSNYIDFKDIELLELNQNNITDNVFLNENRNIEIKNIDSNTNELKLNLSTDYKSTMPEYIEAVKNNECIYIDFDLTATEKKLEFYDSDGNINYFWNTTNELIYSSEEDNSNLLSIELKFINIPYICLD